MKLGPLLRLLTRLTVFCTPLVVGFGLLEWRLRSVPTGLDYKHELLLEKGPSAQIVILGSSHEAHGLDPSLFHCPAINLANDSQTIDIDAALVRENLSTLKQLRVLIVPISFHSLQARTAPDIRRHHSEDALRRWLKDSRLARYTPRGAIEVAFHGFVPPPRNADHLGWTPHPVVPGSTSPYEARKRFEAFKRWMDPANAEALALDLRAILGGANGVGATPVVLVTPVHRNFVSAWPPGELSAFRDNLLAVAREHSAVLADYSQDPRFTEPDFADSDHLSPEGARRFSLLLAREVLARFVQCEDAASPKPAP